MTRYHRDNQDQQHTHREWRKHYVQHVESNVDQSAWHGIGRSPYDVDCSCDAELGRFRKQKAGDCGIPQCQICHGDKYPRREPTRQEIDAAMRFREQIEEVE